MIIVCVLMFFLVVQATAAVSKSNSCTSVTLDKDEVNLFQNVYGNLDTFLERNLESGQKNLAKVLSGSGVDGDVALKIDYEAPLENTILQYQIAIHKDMKMMFNEVKSLLSAGHNSYLRSANKVTKGFEKLREEKYQSLSQKVSSDDKTSSLSVLGGNIPSLKDPEVYIPTDFTFRPSDCSDILVSGLKNSGVYEIYPFRCQPVKVYCDMETDGGGWTVFLSRRNDSTRVNFTKNWEEYKNGFGTPGEEHWLGNEYLHTLTYNRNYILRFEAKDGEGREIWGEYNTFKVDSEHQKYNLSLTTFNVKSTAYDHFDYANGNFFSTYDRDSDKYTSYNCAEERRGGWWYNSCAWYNPTGEHDKQDQTGIRMNPWSKDDSRARYAVWVDMKMRPKICSSAISVVKVNTHNCAFN